MSKELTEAVIAVFDEFGVKYSMVHGGKHPCFHWNAIDGSARKTAIPFSESDYRSIRNSVAQLRRALHEAGYGSTEIVDRHESLVALSEGAARCSSLDVAERFGKAHKDVLRSIDRVREDCGAEFDQRNFAPISYRDKSGREYRAFSMTRDGFSLVAMGFTGSDATAWKVRYIEAFNRLESEVVKALPVPSETAYSAIRADLEALTDIVLSLPSPVQQSKPRGIFINPVFIIRQRRVERRSRRVSA